MRVRTLTLNNKEEVISPVSSTRGILRPTTQDASLISLLPSSTVPVAEDIAFANRQDYLNVAEAIAGIEGSIPDVQSTMLTNLQGGESTVLNSSMTLIEALASLQKQIRDLQSAL